MVGTGLEQQWVHVRVAGDTGGFGLHSLSTAYLQALGGGVAVQSHILRLEGCGAIAVLSENAAKGSGHDALAYVTAGASEHDGV